MSQHLVAHIRVGDFAVPLTDVLFRDVLKLAFEFLGATAYECGHAGALVLEQPLTDRPTFIQFSHQVFFLGDGIVEKRFAER